jgi:hypothetical protein
MLGHGWAGEGETRLGQRAALPLAEFDREGMDFLQSCALSPSVCSVFEEHPLDRDGPFLIDATFWRKNVWPETPEIFAETRQAHRKISGMSQTRQQGSPSLMIEILASPVGPGVNRVTQGARLHTRPSLGRCFQQGASNAVRHRPLECPTARLVDSIQLLFENQLYNLKWCACRFQHAMNDSVIFFAGGTPHSLRDSLNLEHARRYLRFLLVGDQGQNAVQTDRSRISVMSMSLLRTRQFSVCFYRAHDKIAWSGVRDSPFCNDYVLLQVPVLPAEAPESPRCNRRRNAKIHFQP